MIIFDSSLLMSNFVQEALDSFDKIYITQDTLEYLNALREDTSIIQVKKATEAINLIYSYYRIKIFIIDETIFNLLGHKDNEIYFADKYKFLRYTTIKRSLICKEDQAQTKMFKPNPISDNFLISNDVTIFQSNNNPLHLKINDYFIFKTETENCLYKVTKDYDYVLISYQTLKSNEMGEIKPKKNDLYQLAAIDSLSNNQITMLRGPAGTGKSYLAMGALFSKLRNHEIDKIYIFCNPVATRDSARLGFYPGDKNSKLLDSQIGNFLDGKIGDRVGVERLINENKIVLLPMSDIRGFDTNGKKAGIYITEAQNMTIDLMQLALERVGEDCICIIDGDYYKQVDLDIYADINNGMRRVSQVFKGSDIYGEVCLQNVYRSKVASLAAQITNNI